MAFRVNKNLPPSERIPHSLTFGQRDRLAIEYKSLCPRSIVYQLTQLCAFTLVVLATLFVGLRIWGVIATAFLKVGPLSQKNCQILVVDLSDLSKTLGQDVDGILGMSVLKEFEIVSVVLRHHKLVLK